MEYLWNIMVKALVVQVTAGRGKYHRNTKDLMLPLGVPLGPPADFVVGIT